MKFNESAKAVRNARGGTIQFARLAAEPAGIAGRHGELTGELGHLRLYVRL